MSTQSIAAPFPIFCDRDGSPLDAGYIYVGAVNLPPQTNPIAVYWDADLTIPAAQPIRTSGGYAMRNGSPSRIYAAGQYSLLVTDWKGQLVYSSAQSDGVSVGASVQSFSGTGAQTNFTLAADPGVAESLIVRISGAVQTPGVDFTVSGTTLSFTEAPPAGTGNIVVQAIGEVGVSGAGSLVNASAVVYSDTTPLPTILTPQGLGGAVQVNTSTGAVSIGSNLGVVGAVTLSAGTANGILYLNGSKVATSGSALTFNGSELALGVSPTAGVRVSVRTAAATGTALSCDNGVNTGFAVKFVSNLTSIGNEFSQPLAFLINNAEQMRLDSTGLGIGTASPGTRLHVQAGTAATGNSAFFVNQDGTNNPYLQIQHSSVGVKLFNSSSAGGSANNLIFGNGSTAETMRLDASGNLGLGVTPSAWSGNYKAIQSGNSSAFVGFSGNSQTFVVSNAYNDGSWKYREAAGAGYYAIQGVSNGVHSWFVAGSGAANAAITFTQAMTLDASGNWYLGTAALATTATAGFPWIPSCAGVPTGAPTAPYTNAAALVVDTTNNRLYVRVGSTWRYASLI